MKKLNDDILEKSQKIYSLLFVFANQGHSSLKTASGKIEKDASPSPQTDTGEYGHGTLLEICIYLLSRLDTSLFKYGQDRSIRRDVVSFIVKTLNEKFEKHLEQKNITAVINQRMIEYGRCFHERERNKEKAIEDLHSVLVNNIRHTRKNNELKLWDTGVTPIALPHFITDSLTLMVFERHDVLLFQNALKHLFLDNKNFTKLSSDVMEIRINDGIYEAEKITKNLHEDIFE